MRHQFRRAMVTALLFVLPSTIASAQGSGSAFQSRNWRGEVIDYACRASPRDAEGLRQALIRQELFRIGAETKAATGWFYGDRLRNARLRTRESTATQIVDRIKLRLREDARSVRTSILIYDVGVRRGQSMLCAWLLTTEGIAAAETVPVTTSARVRLGGFAENARNSLGVTRVTMARAPSPRGIVATLPPNLPVVGTNIAGAPDLNAISELLLPMTVRNALLSSRSERILVLPAADFSTVPFAALPIAGPALIASAASATASRSVMHSTSILMVTGIAELVAPPKRDIWPPRFRDPKLSLLIVGAPDPTMDELQSAQLPGALEEAKSVALLLEKLP